MAVFRHTIHGLEIPRFILATPRTALTLTCRRLQATQPFRDFVLDRRGLLSKYIVVDSEANRYDIRRVIN